MKARIEAALAVDPETRDVSLNVLTQQGTVNVWGVLPGFGLEREVMRVIEAVRLHAAGHEGRLPDKLADITAVPVPLDPGTGRSFEYQVESGTATLIGPPLNVPVRKNQPVPKTGLRYRLTIKGKG